jgi:3-phosphoshikimate 1-carboxyvinyltransferase
LSAPPLPADKSIAHRALLLAAGAAAPSRLVGVGRADDVGATESCLRALGVGIERSGDDVVVTPPASLSSPAAPLDAGNAGTCARLLAGWLAGRGVAATLTGDASLRRRPMARVAKPVNALFETPALSTTGEGTLPLEVRPARGRGGELVVDTRVPSAQVKSAVLLAALGLAAPERRLAALGAPVRLEEGSVSVVGPASPWRALEGVIPRDPSAVALLVVGALASERPATFRGVGLNPTRLGFVSILGRMGAAVHVEVEGSSSFGEPFGELRVEPARLGPAVVEAHEVPACIDELPALAALAATAEGTSRFRGAGELRHKESDRLAALVAELSAAGASARVEGDDLVVEGRPGALLVERVDARGDHRMEMALLALGRGLGHSPALAGTSVAQVSFPDFDAALAAVIGR